MSAMHVSALAFAAGLVTGLAGSAQAGEPHRTVPQLAGITTDLGHHASALTYWVDDADGVHVVTTIDTVVDDEAGPDPERHAIVRFSALILPGQSQVISVPGPVGSQPQALRIRRLENQLGKLRIEVDSVLGPQLRAQTSPSATTE